MGDRESPAKLKGDEMSARGRTGLAQCVVVIFGGGLFCKIPTRALG